MWKVSVMCLGMGMFVTGCMFDSADAPVEDQEAATQALAAPECPLGSNGDNFQLLTGDRCGRADFVDNGPGAPGGGDNDDYIIIHDYCEDHHGVKVWAWKNGRSVDNDVGGYNGQGLAGDPVIWDPFKHGTVNDLLPGDCLGVRVCLADGANDHTGASCRDLNRRITGE